MHKSVTRGTVKSVTKTVDEAGEETVQIIEDVVIHGPQKSQVVTKKKQFWSNWGVIGGTSSQASKTVTTENRDWKVISSVSQTTLSKKPQTDFPGKEQTDFVEVKVDGASTGKYHIHFVSEYVLCRGVILICSYNLLFQALVRK